MEIDPNIVEVQTLPDMDKQSTASLGGLFITFEGIDASGKSLQAELLVQKLQQRGFVVCQTRDPGGPILSEDIRGLLLNPVHRDMDSAAELFLYLAARCQLLDQVIRPALSRGEVVICDRFTDSTLAYQGWGRGLDIGMIVSLNTWICGGIAPHRTYILDIALEESLRRRHEQSVPADRMEQEAQHFHLRVREGYLTIAREEPERVRLLDGTRPVAELELEIFNDVLRFINRPENDSQDDNPCSA